MIHGAGSCRTTTIRTPTERRTIAASQSAGSLTFT
jgi:hypothetical protein